MRTVGWLLVAIGVTLGLLHAPAGAADSSIEATYAVVGPWPVSTSQLHDGAGRTFDVYQPTDLGGVRHPIVTWGNGSLTPSAAYDRTLRHLASWGFVVAASTSTWTGSGEDMLAAVSLLAEHNEDPASSLYQRVDPTRIGAVGHSQGGYGALNATLKSGGLITTAVPVGLADVFWLSPLHRSDLTELTQDVFFVGGDNDWLSTPVGLLGYVEQIPGAAAVAVRAGTTHESIITDPDAYLGYITAWLRYQLSDDAAAAAAFVGAAPEITSNSAWTVPFHLDTAH